MISLSSPLPYPPFLIGVIISVVLGCGSAAWLFHRAGYSPLQITAAVLTLSTSLLVGSKLLFIAGSWAEGNLTWQVFRAELLSRRLRLPGGFFFALFTGALVARALRVKFLYAADAVVPAAGLTIVGLRIGCFLEGCCYGYPTSVPWAVRFPRWTEAYWWQLANHIIPYGAPTTLPTHPLQLYFALAGLAIFVGLMVARRYKRYDGELVLLFFLAYLWSTWLLEFMRANKHPITHALVFVTALGATAIWVWAERRFRVQRASSSHADRRQPSPSVQDAPVPARILSS